MTRILVAGIGNIFLGDDGFGVEVVKRLAAGPLPAPVRVVDFGIRGIHLAYELTGEPYDLAILVDAVPRGTEPGTLFLIEPAEDEGSGIGVPDGHSLDPAAVLGFVRRLGEAHGRILVVGCEPSSVEEGMELTPPVAAAVERAVTMVRGLIDGALARDRAAGVPASSA